jgi:DNA-3-methyladenine glycosylase I
MSATVAEENGPLPAPGGAGGSGGAGAGVVVGADGRARCPWGLSAPEYVEYHDEEWGRRVRDTVGLFERLTLEAFQSGLSWLTILRKRPAFRAAFADFDPAVVADFGPADVERLLGDAGIVRNRRKIEATVVNARAVLALDRPLTELIWSHQPPASPRPVTLADVPARTSASVALAKSLRAAGFVFIGPTTAYALMQACGLVDDHLADCWVPGVAGGEPTI